MSITFTANITDPNSHSVSEPCLCAQMAESFSAAMGGDFSEAVTADLQANAQDGCPWCKGTGVETREQDDSPELNLNNDSAQRILAVLGIPFDHCGEISLPEARRAVLKALNSSGVSALERPEEAVYGRPRAQEDGSVALRPLRSYSPPLTTEDILSRVRRFSALVEEAASRGATQISWN